MRAELDKLDQQIAEFLLHRSRQVREIWDFKSKSHIPLLDPHREFGILEKIEKLSSDKNQSHALSQIFTTILDHTKPRADWP